MAVREVQVYDYVRFTEAAVKRPRVVYANAGDTLRFTENRKATTPHRFLSQTLSAHESVEASVSGRRDVTDTLAFTELAARVREGWAYQNLVMAQSSGKGRDASQALAFAETASGTASRLAGNVLPVAQTVTVGFERRQEPRETLAPEHAATAYVENPKVVVDPTVPPPARPHHTVTLSSGAGTVVLPAPDFDNTEVLTEQRVNRRSMGGTLIVFHDPMWMESDTFEVAFSYLSEAQVRKLRSVVAGSLGKLVTFTDHEGRSWSGVVTTPELTVTQDGRHNTKATFKVLVAS